MTHKTRIGRIRRIENKARPKFSNADLFYHAVIVKHNGDVFQLMLTDSELQRAYERAKKNPEDQLTQSVISRILD
jgi:hypothetical protein